MKRWTALTAAAAVACSSVTLESPVQAKQPDLAGDPDLKVLCEFPVGEYGGFKNFGDCISGFHSSAPAGCKALRDADLLDWAGYDSFADYVRSSNPGTSMGRRG